MRSLYPSIKKRAYKNHLLSYLLFAANLIGFFKRYEQKKGSIPQKIKGKEVLSFVWKQKYARWEVSSYAQPVSEKKRKETRILLLRENPLRDTQIEDKYQE